MDLVQTHIYLLTLNYGSTYFSLVVTTEEGSLLFGTTGFIYQQSLTVLSTSPSSIDTINKLLTYVPIYYNIISNLERTFLFRKKKKKKLKRTG